MDQGNRVMSLVEGETVPQDQVLALKQMLPECLVSVKLETYEDSSSSERPSARSLEAITELIRTACCGQPAHNCSCSDPKSTCVVIAPSSPTAFTCQLLTPAHANMMSHHEQPTSQHQQQSHANNAQAIVLQPAAHPRTAAAAHTLSHAWLPHYNEPATSVQASNAQQYPHHQMQYLTADGTLITQAAAERLMIKPSSNSGNRNDNAGIISTASGISAAETCDPNTFINYVLNHQRTGGVGGGIFLSFEPPRSLSSQVVQHEQVITTSREDGSSESSRSLKHERSVEEASRNSTPADNSDNGSAADSPNPSEVVGNQVSRYCQTMPVTPLQQDAKTSTDDFDEECLIGKNSHSSNNEAGSFIIKHGVKHATFGHIIPPSIPYAVSNNSPLNNTNESESHLSNGGEKCLDQAINSRSEIMKQHSSTHVQTNMRRVETSKTDSADSKLLESKVPASVLGGADPAERVYRCEICGKTYPSQQALVNHDRYHRGDRPYECETCHKAFATNSHLVTHRRTHTGERPFQCHICHRCFADRSAYMKHERTHGPNGSIIKRYKCDECGNAFVDSCGLKKHTRIHTGERPYICLVCHKAFSTSSTFVAHKRIHTGERPYKCESCEKMFVTKSHLLTHRRKHTGEKPFSCSVCNRCFADGSSFRRHEKLHTNENRHMCDICGRGFPLESSLGRHKETHFTYVYTNRDDLMAMDQQQPQHSPHQQQPQQEREHQQHTVIACDVQQAHCVIQQESIPVESDHSNIGVDLSQDMAS